MSNVSCVDFAPYLIGNFNLYAGDVIKERALPDIRDGLKPVQRRILYAMYCLGLYSNSQYKKCARTVGETLGKFHPHGDQSVYDALVNMAQFFTKRYPLVNGHGNMGSIDGDGAAAMRYTEAKLSSIGELLLKDINKDTVDYISNYDESEEEPSVLPGLFPQLLCNGSTGIAVGMACSFAPHFANDVYKACDKIIEDCINNQETDIDSLIDIIKAPDFPTGGIIVNPTEVRKAYKTGKGKVVIRSKYIIETNKDKNNIVFTEIPYKVNKSNLVIQIDNLRKTKLPSIKEVRDESDKDGIRIVVELKKGTNVEWILQNLFKDTMAESSFSINHTAIIDGKPHENIDLKTLIESFVLHSINIIERKCNYDLIKSTNRKNIVDGILIALSNIDRIINIIKTEDDDKNIINIFSEEFGLNEVQTKNIINTKLGVLKRVSIERLEIEQEELNNTINKLNDILNNKILLLIETQKSLKEISSIFDKDERKTTIQKVDTNNTVTERELVKDENVVITLTNNGIIKSVKETDYNVQKRNGTGTNTLTKVEDKIQYVMNLSTKDDILLFTNTGYCYILPAYSIPISKKNLQGKYLNNYIDLEEKTKILNVIASTKNDRNKHIILVTKKGLLKLMTADTIKTKRDRLKVITLNDDDEIASVLFIDKTNQISLFTSKGYSITININDIRPIGRTGMGVKGIRLKEDDYVVSAAIYDKDKTFLISSKNGMIKRCYFHELRAQNRGGSGVSVCKLNINDNVASVVSLLDNNDILLTTQEGKTIRIKSDSVPIFGKQAKGVKGIKLSSTDSVISINLLEKDIGENVYE